MATLVVARTNATSGVSDCADEWPHASLRGLTILLGALAGVADPQVTEDLGATVSVNDNARRGLGVAGTVRGQPPDRRQWAGERVRRPPTDEGARLEQLKTIVALRDSGSLTDGEFEAEKRTILEDR